MALSPLTGKFHQWQSQLSDEARAQRIVPVSTRAVVVSQLLKSTISLADYQSSTEEMIADVVGLRRRLEEEFSAYATAVTPKAIYVVETSNTGAKEAEPRPVSIWKHLVNRCQVSPESIALCTSTRDLPKGAIKVESIDMLSDSYTHIIFNKKLQEGWDDPSVYICYFDGKTESATRIQQVIGRALRQPSAHHMSDEDLNTAYFFVNCPTALLDKITDDLKEELRIYKGDNEVDDFEPFQFKEERKALPRIPLKDAARGRLTVPRLQLELPRSGILAQLIEDKTYDFGEEDRAAPGRALVSVVSVRTGATSKNIRDLAEDMRVKCGAFLHEQIRVLSRGCANSLPPKTFSNQKLDKTACYKSKAIEHYRELAKEIKQEYENHVKLELFSDATELDYCVEEYQPSGSVPREFNRHESV